MMTRSRDNDFNVAILGASGLVGRSTMQYFNDHPIPGVSVTAFVRDPDSDKAQGVKTLPHIQVTRGDMSDERALAASLKGFNSAYIITPGDDNRNEITESALRAAKTAGVGHVLVVSVPTVHRSDQSLGLQLSAIEDSVKSCGIPYTILRLPVFMDDNLVHAESIKSQSTVFFPIDPQIPYVAIALMDVGEASARILADPSKHQNTTYVLSSAPFTIKDLTSAVSNLLGKEVQYVRVSYDEAKQLMMSHGFTESQATGVSQLLMAIDKKDEIMMKQSGDFRKITGRDPMTIQQWAQTVAALFM